MGLARLAVALWLAFGAKISFGFATERRRIGVTNHFFEPYVTRATKLFSSGRQEETLTTRQDEYTVKVSYEGISRVIPVLSNESILSAMERLNIAQEVGMPDLPSDCRRGCCLSCSARHVDDSDASNLYQGTDGLNQNLSKEMADDGFVLTCSSFVSGDGVHLSLAHNWEAWQTMYQERLLSEEVQLSGREAMAKVIRQRAERHIDEWIDETEHVLLKNDVIDMIE